MEDVTNAKTGDVLLLSWFLKMTAGKIVKHTGTLLEFHSELIRRA